MSAPVISIFDGAYDDHIHLAAAKLREGGVVVLPMETVYGAAAALNRPAALARLRQLRPPAPTGDSQALVPHLADPADAARFLGPLTEFGQRCIRKLWPGPVALIFSVP